MSELAHWNMLGSNHDHDRWSVDKASLEPSRIPPHRYIRPSQAAVRSSFL